LFLLFFKVVMAPLGAADAYLRLTDTDGDTIEFYLTRNGMLQEWVNGKLELPHVRSLSYITRTGLVKDDTGEFNIRAGECDQKTIVLQAMARCAGVRWRGGEYLSITEVCVNLVGGDRLIFRISDTTGTLQEYFNGKLELAKVLHVTYNKYLGSITDQDWDFRIRPDECVEKVYLLRHLCWRAGVPWNGDKPTLWTKPPSTVARVLPPYVATSGPGDTVQRQKQTKNAECNLVKGKPLFQAPREQSNQASYDYLREAKEIVEAKAQISGCIPGSGGGWLDELEELERIAAELEVQRRIEKVQEDLEVAAGRCARERVCIEEARKPEESKPLQETMDQVLSREAARQLTCAEDCMLAAKQAQPCFSEAATQTIERCEDSFNAKRESDLPTADEDACALCEVDEKPSRNETSGREMTGKLHNGEKEGGLLVALESRDRSLAPLCFSECDREVSAANSFSEGALLNESQSCEQAGFRAQWTMEESAYADIMALDFNDRPSDSIQQLAEEGIPDAQVELHQLDWSAQANEDVDDAILQSLCEKGMFSESMLAPRDSGQTYTIEGWEMLPTSLLSDSVSSPSSQLRDSVASQLGTEWFTLCEDDDVQANDIEDVIHCEETTADNYVQYFLLSDEEDVDETLGFTEL
jgi:hypothetical protein